MVVLAAAATLLVGMVSTAGAAAPPIGKDGTIHACYRVKGKPKGGLRVVPSAKTRCKRGERKVVWSAAGPGGQVGANGTGQSGAGTGGAQGQSGSSGTAGTPGANEVALKTEVASLSLKLEGLEGVLQGIGKGDLTGLLGKVNVLEGVLGDVSNTDLTGVLGKLDGVTNEGLLGAVGSLPLVETLCDQNSELAKQVNLLQGVIGGLGLTSGLEALGLLKIPTLPTALNLNEFGCPA